MAMESTGTYWQTLFSELQLAGIEVILVNGKFTKNIKGKKTDVLDCMWIQKLHSLGMLSGSFLPDAETEKIRTFCRQRAGLIETAAIHSQKMQKYLRLLNLRLDVVVNDICGQTGLSIIEAVCKGETNPEKLASFRNHNCKKSEEEIAKALQSNKRSDYLFCLQQELEMYKQIQKKIEDCDKQISKQINENLKNKPERRKLKIAEKPHKRINKNTPKDIDLNKLSYQLLGGVDLFAIEGFSYGAAMTIISELGEEGLRKFPTAKQFASWTRLSPNNKISGGKILSTRVPSGSNRVKIALRQVANVVGKMKDTHLSDFFRRVSYRKGRNAAVSATARKMAVIVWNMVVKKQEYNPPKLYEFLDQKRKKKVAQIQKIIANFEISEAELTFS